MAIETWIVFFAKYFPYFLAALFVAFAFSRFGARKTQFFLLAEGAISAFVSRGAVEIIRLFVHRLRPFIADASIIPLSSETSYSFPSGHASFFFTLSTVVYFYNKRWGLWFYAASLLIGLARVMAGVHYPTDILGGAVLGVVVGWCVHRFFRKSSAEPFKARASAPPLGKEE